MKKADIHKEVGEIVNQEDLFRLKDIQSKSQLEEVEKGEMAEGKEDEESESDGESLMSGSKFLLVQIKLLTYDLGSCRWPGNQAMHAGCPPQQVHTVYMAASVHVANKTRLDLCCVYPWCAVAHQECCFCQFWFVPFLAEMAHHDQSPYRTGVLFLPILA